MSKKSNRGNNAIPISQSDIDTYNLRQNFAKFRNNKSTNDYSKSSYQNDRNNGLHTQLDPINYDNSRTINSIPDTNKYQSDITTKIYEVNSQTITTFDLKIEKKLDKDSFYTFFSVATVLITLILFIFYSLSYTPYLSKVDNNKNQIDTLTRKIDNHLYNLENRNQIKK